MSVRNAGSVIREAREKAGLSAAKLSDGICDCQTLYRIERGEIGFSPATFQDLMSRIGGPGEVFPVFANRDDFDCFFALKHARFHLDSWQLESAFNELKKIENLNWANNKIHYQEWILLYVKMLFRSGFHDHELLMSYLKEALQITKPDCDLLDIHKLLLSITETELLLMIAQEYLCLSDDSSCFILLTQLKTYLDNSMYAKLEKERLYTGYNTIYTKYLIQVGNYSSAYDLAATTHHEAVIRADDTYMLELTFLKGLAQYHLKHMDEATDLFLTAIFSAHAIESCYATTCMEYIKATLHYKLPASVEELPPLTVHTYPALQLIDISVLSNGTFDFFDPDVIRLGKLIRILRKEQKLSQHTLCQGLCSDSALSKIENETLQPNMLLAEALLQRLGLSEREFIFWGDSREAQIHELIFELIHAQKKGCNTLSHYVNQLKLYVTEKDFLLQQYIYFFNAILETNINKRLFLLQNALSITLPNFDINQIHNYRLTWIELSIVNNLALSYKQTDTPHIGISYFFQILNYYNNTLLDIILLSNTQTVTISKLPQLLYSEKRFREITEFNLNNSYNILKYRFSAYGVFLFYYTQALCEINNNFSSILWGRYAYYIEKIVERAPNSNVLKNALLHDFHIDIP